jgi:hypothetical protein
VCIAAARARAHHSPRHMETDATSSDQGPKKRKRPAQPAESTETPSPTPAPAPAPTPVPPPPRVHASVPAPAPSPPQATAPTPPPAPELGPSVAAAAAFVVGAATRWTSLSRRGSQLEGTPLAWVGYDPFPNAPLQIKRFHRAIRCTWLHQVVLAVALAFAIELVWANGSVVVLVFLAGVFLETLTPVTESVLPKCERRYYGLTRAIVVVGLLLCAAVLLAEPCGGSYGADRPATILA